MSKVDIKNELQNSFETRYKALNKEQKEAVDTIEGPVLVVAGPGTGKTTILTLRIAQILRKTQIDPGNILAITYTNSGVRAMREKLKEVIGNRAHDVAIYTFHSFASAMISEYPDHFIKLGNFRQMSDVEVEALIRRIIEDNEFSSIRPSGRPDAYIYSIVRTISDAKKDAMTPELVKEHALSQIEKIKKDETNISSRGASKGNLKAEALKEIEKLEKTILLSGVYKKYEEEKTKLKLRDYDDLIIELLIALKNDQLFLRLVQERFQYILVDEHQDTNDAQNFIVGLIAEFFQTPNVFVVGDEKQAIYRFQGASVENFLRLQKIWPSMKVISLNKNYRSHQSILDASFAMIENNYKKDEHKDLRVELLSDGRKKSPIDIVSAENNFAMEEYLVEKIKEITKNTKKGVSETVVIITRRNRELERVLRLLEANDIAVSSERSIDIFHHPVGSVFFDLLQYLADSSRFDSLARTITFGLWGFSYKESIEALRLLKSGNLEEVLRLAPNIKNLNKVLISNGPLGAIVKIAEESGFTSLVARKPSFVHIWRGIVTLAESITRDTQIENPSELILKMLEYRQSAESKPVKVSVGAPDLPVKAMTAHGSKGLEFDYVFIPYANDEAWIGKSWGQSFSLPKKNLASSEVPDIRRLFYVAITRARKHVTILSALEESDGRELTPLRFISELKEDTLKKINLPRLDISPKESISNKLFDTEYDDLLTSEAKKVVLENGLSVTALNHFLECPSKFLYESILKLPQAPAVSAEKGSAMHLALSNVWNQNIKDVKGITKIINEVTAEYIDKSFLGIKQKELLKSEIKESADVVAKSLKPHFERPGKVSTEKWVETSFDSEFNQNKLAVSLHGKLDAIIENGDTISVFDYKTKKAMTENAVKRDDNGGYFRQLVFYKLLLSKNNRFGNKKMETSLVFLTPNEDKECEILTMDVSSEDIKMIEKEVNDLLQTVWSGGISAQYCSQKDCEYCAYRRITG
jgi:DNA helicase-2/ATP-dependent DNA helicase PcrA